MLILLKYSPDILVLLLSYNVKVNFECFYRCTGDDDFADELRNNECARFNVNGNYCGESLFDGIVNEDLSTCDDENEEIDRDTYFL